MEYSRINSCWDSLNNRLSYPAPSTHYLSKDFLKKIDDWGLVNFRIAKEYEDPLIDLPSIGIKHLSEMDIPQITLEEPFSSSIKVAYVDFAREQQLILKFGKLFGILYDPRGVVMAGE